ncbi:hypothetical protein C8Q75DRAFT_741167 [Abortiporus biennis]|nr:hypothetical protein C8Q75DRAFT_741167 [Abortiporus biennis]
MVLPALPSLNERRSRHLQYFVDSIAKMQEDISKYAERMDKYHSEEISPVVNKLLGKQEIGSIDVLTAKTTNGFSLDDMHRFKKLIEMAKNLVDNDSINWEQFVAGLLFRPDGGRLLNTKQVLAVGRFTVRASGIQAIAHFFRTAQFQGTTSIPAVTEKLISIANENAKALRKFSDQETVAASNEVVSKAADETARIAVCVKLLTAIGYHITMVIPMLEIIQFDRREQKEKSIEAIHNCQTARLCIAYFAAEAKDIFQQLELYVSYLKLLADAKDASSKEAASKVSTTHTIICTINIRISLTSLWIASR